MKNFLQLVLILLFDSDRPFYIVIRILYIMGAWRILRKSGVKSWWALIPWAREYQLARCASREPEGRVIVRIGVISTFLNAASLYAGSMTDNSMIIRFSPLIVVFLISILIMYMVYNIRIFSGFTEVYGVSKGWIVFYIFNLPFVPMLIWGFSKKYQPKWKVEDLNAEMERLATHGSAAVMDKGLTVNIKDRHVSEFFHKRYLLKDIHVAIPQGHMVLLLGGSGAGKTTFLNAVNGYEKANAEITLNGVNMYTQYKKMQYEVGFVPQQEMMRNKDKVDSSLMDIAQLRLSIDIPKKEYEKRVNNVMDTFGLTPVSKNLVEKLSGGQKKRLSISMEFLSNPSLFILDEPDSGLDGVMARELFEQLRQIADTGKIVIVITHTPDRVIDLFDDVIVLAKDSTRTGRLAFYGSIEEARQFFGKQRMEEIVKSINQKEEGGEGRADEFILKYAEVQNG